MNDRAGGFSARYFSMTTINIPEEKVTKSHI